MKMDRLTEKDPTWIDDEFWCSAREPDDELINEVYLKLKTYEDADESGLLVLPPCKLGDTVYAIYCDEEESAGGGICIDEVYVDTITCELWGDDEESKEIEITLNGYLDIEDAYFSRAEAEAALERSGA